MTPATRESTSWIASLRRNVGAKVLAGVIAFALWLFVNAGQREIDVFEFPVEYVNLPELSMVVNDDRLDTVSVKLNGPGALLASLDTRRIPISLDLTNVPVGPAMRRKIRNHMIHVPRGVRILDIEPSRVPVRLETIVRKSVPISLARTGEPQEGFLVSAIEVAPREVAVAGPESVVKKLSEIETEPMDLEGIDAGTRRVVALVRSDPHLSFTPERATVTVQVEQIIETRNMGEIALIVRNVDRPFRLRPSHVKLTVRGPKIVLATLTLPAGSVWVDAKGLGPGTHTVGVTTDLPPGVTVATRTPASVELEIRELETTENGVHK